MHKGHVLRRQPLNILIRVSEDAIQAGDIGQTEVKPKSLTLCQIVRSAIEDAKHHARSKDISSDFRRDTASGFAVGILLILALECANLLRPMALLS